MSMTVSAANYQSSMLQNTRTAGAEKHGQKDAKAEAGKTQQSTVSASLDQINMGEDGITVTEVSRQQGTEQSARQSASPRMDTVEISAEGLAASAAGQDRQTESSSAMEYEYEAEDLSEYTDSELKQMYYRGDITRQEYEDETGETLE